MIKVAKKVLLGIVILAVAAMFSGGVVAEDTISVMGTINEDYQLVDDGGMVYDIADNDLGYEVSEHIGKKVSVIGTVTEEEGSKTITIASYKIIEE